ncbi:unnamed protein product [Allacma fusca]|uniref:Uncharacterized protein n=1 Tax=Allacma fusca TaxID=39272 RepID=A0A8J2PHR9_9HEXA|nr:unnamed protein product [Allacma fusca]
MQKQTNQLDLTAKILQKYLHFGYLVMLVPFKGRHIPCGRFEFVYRGATSKFMMLAVQILCFCNQAWCLVFYHLIFTRHDDLNKTIRVIITLPTIAYNSVLIFILWNKKSDYEELLNCVRSITEKLYALGARLPSKTCINAGILFVISHTVLSVTLDGMISGWNQAKALDTNGNTGDTYPYGSYIEILTLLNVDSSSAVSYSIAILSTCLKTYEHLITRYADQLCLTLVISLYMITRCLLNFLEDFEKSNPKHKDVIHVINDIFDISDMIEKIHGLLIFWCSFSFLPYYSYTIKEVYRNIPGSRPQFATYILTFSLVMWISAETNSKINGVASWLRKTSATRNAEHRELYDRIDGDQINTILHQISFGGFGIKGKAFTITYGLVGSVSF